MSDTDVTLATVTTMLRAKLDSLNIELYPSHARYKKEKKKIQISVDNQVDWSYKWTNTFGPSLGQVLLLPLSSTLEISLVRKHRVLPDHLLGSYSGRVIDFLLDKEKRLTLQDDSQVTCATVTIRLSPVVDFQQAMNDWVDTNLARLENTQALAEGLDNLEQARSAVQTMNYAVQTCGEYVAPLGQALRLMIKLIDNVADAHPMLKLGWTLLSSVYKAIQQQKIDDRDIQGLAEDLRELIGVASDCPVAEIKGTPDVIQSIERFALQVASLIDEYTRNPFLVRAGKVQITNIRDRITTCQAEVKALYEKLRTRIMAYTAKRIDEIKQGIKEMQEDAKRRDADKLVKTIREWLKAHNASINHKSARDTYVEGTGSWLSMDERFLVWLNNPGTTLLITGGPGFGKTVLFSTTVDGVRKHTGPRGSTRGCAYFYFDGRESGAELQKFETLLRSVLAQLCLHQADIPDAMKRLYCVDGKDHPEPTLSQLRTTLQEVVMGFDDVYILIDALDECDSRAELLDWMKSLQSTTHGLHLLATSRPERFIEERMSNSRHVRISLSSELLDNDIRTYVDRHVKASEDLKLLMTEEMKKKLRKRGDGMFRLVAFWIDDLKHCLNAEDITETLERLPTSLNGMYTSMVSKINPNHLLYAQAIIRWLLFSVRQLKPEELAAVACFGFSDGRPSFNRNRCFPNPKAVLDVCGGLVVVSQDRFTLAHLTVKEFLLQEASPLHVNEPDAHSFIARSCLTYLLDHFQPRTIVEVGEFPLHGYAVDNWMPHASSTREIEEANSVIFELALKVLHPWHETFQLWLSAWQGFPFYWAKKIYPTPLFISAGWGFQKLTAGLLALGVCCTTLSESGDTALHQGAQYGHAKVLHLLIEKGADLNVQGHDSKTPLHLACSNGHLNIVELLVQQGADLNVQDRYSNTPLHLACSNGHLDIVELLVQKGADLNVQDHYSNTPLHLACSNCHLDIVELLVQKGADLNVQDDNSSTPLHWACSDGHLNIVELLVQKGADPNVQDEDSDTPLHLACSSGHLNIVELLVQKGADLNVQNCTSISPLHNACFGGHLNIVEVLVQKGADKNAQDEDLDTPLHVSSLNGCLEVIKLLLAEGADPHVKNNDSLTPLDIACRQGHNDIVDVLSVAS